MTDYETRATATLADASPFRMLFREVLSPYQRLRRTTRHQFEQLNRQAGVIIETAPARPRYRAKNALSSAVIGWLMTRSGISQMINRGGLSRNVAPAK
jgi:hypothetical protein